MSTSCAMATTSPPRSWRPALRAGVGRIVVDSFDEINRLRALATAGLTSGSVGRRTRLLVRVTPGIEAHTHEFVKTGQEDTKFGFSLASGAAAEAASTLRGLAGFEFVGVHAHIWQPDLRGLRLRRGDRRSRPIRRREPVLGVLHRWRPRRGLRRRGGGTFHHRMGAGRARSGKDGRPAPDGAPHSRAGSRHRRERGCDAVPGWHHQAAPGFALLRRGRRRHVRQPAPSSLRQRVRGLPTSCAAGALDRFAPGWWASICESGDVIVDDARLPSDLVVGDVLATPVTGAYGFAMSSNYNRVLRPPVVFVSDGRHRVVVRRETEADLLACEA